MKLSSVEVIVDALSKAEVRYLIVGGMAVNAHGFLRFTKDIDVVLQLEEGNILRAFAALGQIGYTPIVPVTGAQFANAQMRHRWATEKGMQVLQMWSDAHPETPIDLFVREPFEFDSEYERALSKSLGPAQVRFVSLSTLIEMKEAVGREQDRIDVENLKIRRGDPACD